MLHENGYELRREREDGERDDGAPSFEIRSGGSLGAGAGSRVEERARAEVLARQLAASSYFAKLGFNARAHGP